MKRGGSGDPPRFTVFTPLLSYSVTPSLSYSMFSNTAVSGNPPTSGRQ